ncbi:MAG TPA: bifunctional DNA-formamidopyrimidine glycosylase/DNA-(apurinic or apyrimidinic site) lyase [Candidatus Paceibacterota bacterium]|nr:bifunctional DNA-formamidopyrimidine glycosylase/DNA-(apurinic or apyrimidinic site) lyase [Candidatus Paceibacterota bacterium]
MPELPEVYTIVKYLQKNIKGEVFKSAWTDTPKIFGNKDNFQKLSSKIKGQKIQSVSRVGKNILFNVSDGLTLLAHQKMSGHFLVGHWQQKKQMSIKTWIPDESELNERVKTALTDSSNRFIHVVFEFQSGKMLALSDMRKFARIELVETKNIYDSSRLSNLGPDWWDKPLTAKALFTKLQTSKKYLKPFLLDQATAAGLGNIYADEALFRAGLSPLRRTTSLSLKDSAHLIAAIKKTLALAIKSGGTSFSDYRQANGEKGTYQNHLKVYGRKGEKCLRCQTELKSIKIGQRSAVYCPHCQK